jgi:hypothetical protein
MADKEYSREPTHYVYTVVKREGKKDYWLNLGVVLPHKDGNGFNIFTNAWPHDGKLVCREVGEDVEADEGRREPERAAPPKRRTGSSR